MEYFYKVTIDPDFVGYGYGTHTNVKRYFETLTSKKVILTILNTITVTDSMIDEREQLIKTKQRLEADLKNTAHAINSINEKLRASAYEGLVDVSK